MKKALFIMALCVPAAIVLAASLSMDNVAQTVTVPDKALLTAPAEVELKYDEADPSGNWGLALSKKGHKLAVRFTPPSYPCKILKAIYAVGGWADNPDAWQDPADLVFFTPNLSGKPSTEIGRKQITPYEQGNWNEFDVSALNMNISSGDFFFAAECIKDYGTLPGYPAVMLDFAKPVNHRSWAYTTFVDENGNEFDDWLGFDEFGLADPSWPDMSVGDSVDLMMRVRVDVVGIGEVELGPQGVLSVSPIITASSNTISYTLPSAANVDITLWDALGREVKTLYAGNDNSGEHSLSWDASGLANGTYFIRLKADNFLKMAKVVLVN